MKNLRVFIADDHTVVRMGLVSLIETEDGFEVVGEAEDGDAAVREVLRTQPDIVLMDLLMPRKDGIDATVEILREAPQTKILLLTSSSSSDGIARALEAGAAGAVLKSADVSQLVSILRRIAAGERVLSPEISQLLSEDPPAPRLTSRQEEILESVIRGLTYKDMATQFGIREGSVKEHVAAICQKLGAANRSEVVAIALRKHLLKI